MITAPPRLALDQPDGDVSLLVFARGPERYVFLYDAATRDECLRRLGRFAANPELAFTWYDAALLIEKIRANE